MKKIVAGIGGWLAAVAAKDWALHQGLDEEAASLLSWIAGAATSTAILRA